MPSRKNCTFEVGREAGTHPLDSAQLCNGFGRNTLWIITEADRSVTTFLLPEQY